MNGWQLESELEKRLKERHWEDDAAQDLVFDARSVIVCPDNPQHLGKNLITPIVQITPLGYQTDPEFNEDDDYNQFRYKIEILTSNANDQFGRAALMGASKTDGEESRGRGLDEVITEVHAALQDLVPSTGFSILGTPANGSGITTDDDRTFFAFRDLEIIIHGTNSREYHTAENLRASKVGLAVTVAWSLPPNRFDLFNMILRRAAGSTPPALVTDGTGVTITGGLPYTGMSTSVVDTVPGAGTYSYSLFIQYDESNDPPAAVDRTAYSSVTIAV